MGTPYIPGRPFFDTSLFYCIFNGGAFSVLLSAALYQNFFLFSRKFLYPPFFHKRVLEIYIFFMPYQFHGSAVTRILGAPAGIVQFNPPLEVRGKTGVKRIIAAFYDIYKKLSFSYKTCGRHGVDSLGFRERVSGDVSPADLPKQVYLYSKSIRRE